MAEIEILTWLESWYENLCDGEREHQYGIKITTLDNPGWAVTIDLRSSPFENMPNRKSNCDLSDTDWVFCDIQDRKFVGNGDPRKLGVILHTFRQWVEQV